MNPEELNSRILLAHKSGDGARLAELYHEAGNQSLESGRHDEGCFFLTQAYVYALENGLEITNKIHAQLVGFDRVR